MIKNILLALIALIVLGGGAYLLMNNNGETVTPADDQMTDEMSDEDTMSDDEMSDDEDETTEREPQEVIGTSVNGTDIVAHHFGTGEEEVLFIGGIHSAFAPNTVVVAEELVDALADGTIAVPENLTVTVITDLNPDATGEPNTRASRLNANDVDLNRNFDCDWEAEGVWRSAAVSGGDAAFSEPEAAAVRDYVDTHTIAAAVVYYAAGGGVYVSNCGGELNATVATLTNTYADAAGYSANEEFDAYAISGDMTNWLAKENVPAISVLLSNYTDAEWEENRAGIEAVLTALAE